MRQFSQIIPLWVLLCLPAAACKAQPASPAMVQALSCSVENRSETENYLSKIKSEGLSLRGAGEAASRIGRWFIGKPYIAHTLELPGKEKVVVNWGGLDCTTFLENVVVLTWLTRSANYSFDNYAATLMYVRYRDGELKDYASRLHYFSEWMANNQQKGILRDVSAECGGQPVQKNIQFMSAHRDLYPALARDDIALAAIKESEAALSARLRFVIPKTQIRQHESLIREGDLIAIASGIEGLDYNHVGIASWKNGRLHLLHASSQSMRVEISELPLAEMLAKQSRSTGISVARLNDRKL